MRLIDADALKAKAFGKRKGLVHVADIDDAPTIDAIPVEWIKDRLNKMLKGTASAESCFTIQVMLVDWQKEQEANHEYPDTPEDQS